jgi:carboxyl-terminal processing protease
MPRPFLPLLACACTVPGRPVPAAWLRGLLVAAVTVAGGCATVKPAATPAPPGPSAASLRPPERALETFDAVWATIDAKHFDSTHNGVDWKAVREEFRPQVERCATEAEFRSLLERMIARLDQSHFGIIPREVAGSETPVDPQGRVESPGGGAGDVGLEFRILDGRAVVLRVAPDGAAAAAGIRPGWALLSIDGTSAAVEFGPAIDEIAAAPTAHDRGLRSLLLSRRIGGRLDARPGTARAVTFEDGTGTRREVTLVPAPPAGDAVRFGNLPPVRVSVSSREISSDEFAAAGVTPERAPRIGLISFPIWMPAATAPLDAAVDRFRGMDAIVIDLRGNPGGVGGMVMGFGGHFFTEPVSLGAMQSRDSRLEFRVNPRTVTVEGNRVEPFRGRLAILVDAGSASTSEVFAAGLQELGRATVVGERSAGAALPSVVERLPNGDVLQYAIADFETPKGNALEGRGVTPDVAVDVTREVLLEGGDPALSAALRRLSRELRGDGKSASAGTT